MAFEKKEDIIVVGAK